LKPQRSAKLLAILAYPQVITRERGVFEISPFDDFPAPKFIHHPQLDVYEGYSQVNWDDVHYLGENANSIVGCESVVPLNF
jgi:hypothetical protein